MKKSGAAWGLVGILAGFAGLAAAFLVAEWMHLRLDPVSAVSERVHGWLPLGLVDWARGVPGPSFTTPVLLLLGLGVFIGLGVLARRSRWGAAGGYLLLALLGGIFVLQARGATRWWLLPVAAGFAVAVLALFVLARRLGRLQALPDQEVYGETWRGRRREFLAVSGAVVALGAVAYVAGRLGGREVREVEAERKTQVRSVTAPEVPPGARLDVEGLSAWMTPVGSFFIKDTAVVRPALKTENWTIKIHGLVENELELTFEELVNRGIEESWITMVSVFNEVGGDLVGNAWFSGVLLAPLLAEARPLPDADAVLQTSEDGWTCGTPLEAMTDGRGSMLAVAMNGEPLTIEHGYPVRTVIPGLYGHVSATKWVVDLEVTRFDQITPYWTDRGFAELGPVKLSSRIEVPDAEAVLPAGQVVVAGSAWAPGTGIAEVAVQVDDGEWQEAVLGDAPNPNTWVQWKAALDVEPGEHTVVVRATDKAGLVQTGVVADIRPDGATGLDQVTFTTT
ncbi:molybdopterin-dependent oxidoreductase [Nocardioides sp. GXZ039]|uniref:molybdopterin-dependent oxidoreductase n=1 Tax=Nocardioides sp. GXZ039 TaxID=3136018 RepID=UPI0030F46611